MAWFWVALFWATAGPLAGEDAALVQMRTLLEPMRGTPLEGLARGAWPELTEVKHKLRSWVEGRLRKFRGSDDVDTLSRDLNAELHTAKLSCDWSSVPAEKGCPDRGQPGYLGEVRLHWGEMLVVTTEVGVICGVDQSAYAYYWVDGRWKLFWQS